MSTTQNLSIPELICQLCRQFYDLGWVSGTGGGISIRAPEGIYMAPSGVQKERILPQDVFLLADPGPSPNPGASADQSHPDEPPSPQILRRPADPLLKVSECCPLFLSAYELRGAGAVIHSHSIWSVLAAQIFIQGNTASEFVCQDFEMQKGLRGRGCFEQIRVPIIANTAREAELTDSLRKAICAYPNVDAVLVAGHGIYVWGRTWIEAKTQAECYDYLCRAVVEYQRSGLFDPKPKQGSSIL